MLKSILDQPETQSDALDTLFNFDRPKGSWRIQRPDGQYYKGYESDRVGDVFVANADAAMDFSRESSAQHFLDISFGSAKGRQTFQGCRPVNLTPLLDGDFIVCPTCGILHEGDYCPTAAGHGMVL